MKIKWNVKPKPKQPKLTQREAAHLARLEAIQHIQQSNTITPFGFKVIYTAVVIAVGCAIAAVLLKAFWHGYFGG